MMARFKLGGFLRIVGISLSVTLALGGGYLRTLQLTGNFNIVVAGEFYRSGQLTPSQIAECAKTYGIKTIINLRGDKSGRSWYDAEVTEANRLSIVHLDFAISRGAS